MSADKGGINIHVNAQWEVYALWALVLIPIFIGIPLLFAYPDLKKWWQNRWQKRLAKNWNKPKFVKAEVIYRKET